MSTAKVRDKGQITVPKAVRDALGLKTGDQLVFVIEDGRAYMYPVKRRGLSALRGVGKGLRPFPGRAVERQWAHWQAAREALGLGDDQAPPPPWLSEDAISEPS